MREPFTLTIQPLQNNESLATLFQQRLAVPNGRSISPKELARVTGLPFLALADEILDALRVNHHKPAVLSQKKPIELNEVSGIRLALLFKAIAPLSRVDPIRVMIRRIAAMSDEEIYYWFAKCYGEYADQATHALRVLYGVETVAVQDAVYIGQQELSKSFCACGCGRSVTSHEGQKGRPGKYFSGACRVRAHRATKTV
jgi:hypothetical protein